VSRLTNVVPNFDFTSYGGIYKQYSFTCSKCNSIFQSSIANGREPICRNCYPIVLAKEQKNIESYIQSIDPTVSIESSVRYVISPKELDIYIPEKKLAIEYNGLYWHSEISGQKDKNYHLNKTAECEKQGIQLIHIFENEWIQKQYIIKNILQNKLKISKKIYARNCIIKDVLFDDSQKFLEENHLQGGDKSSICIGLYHKNILVSLMTFCKSRFNKNVEWEMSRFCNLSDIVIVGGSSRLFSYFIKTYCPVSIISYSDRRYFTGNVYKQLGMKFVEYTKPSYFYIKDSNIVGTRLKYQKHKLAKLLPIFDTELTEWENMQANGFDRIWDCGHSKFVWNNSVIK
jgi:DNA-directed RNA polymerase subunit RPC12/RpoP